MREEDFYSQDGAICPYCEHLNKSSDSDGSLYNEELDEYQCEHCGEKFDVSPYVSWSWTTTKIDG